MEFKKYTKIKQLGNDENKGIFDELEDTIVVQEKIDGANFRFFVKDGTLIFGSRTQELGSDKDHKYQKNFQRCINFLTEKFGKMHKDDIKESEGLIFYGECCVPHSLQYDWETIPPYLGFDIYSLKEEKYLDLEHIKFIFETWDLPFVPVIKVCKSGDIKEITDKDIPKSVYSNEMSEGIIFKNYSKQIFGKYVATTFREKNRNAFGKSNKHSKDDTDYVCLTYCTNARIDKIIFKLIDEGEKLDMPLMHKLPNTVYKDIWEENWQEIIGLKRTIDFADLKKKVSKRCLTVLRNMMATQVLNKTRESKDIH